MDDWAEIQYTVRSSPKCGSGEGVQRSSPSSARGHWTASGPILDHRGLHGERQPFPDGGEGLGPGSRIDASSSVTVCFLVPDIHALQTGGNVYNRRMAEELRSDTAVQVVPWTPEETPAPALDLSGADVVVVDSLLAQHPDALRAVHTEHPAASFVLLVHYLRCVDPNRENDDGIGDERATLKIVEGAVTTSRFTRRALVDEGLPPEQVKVARPGLGEQYRGTRPMRLGDGPPRLLTVANLLPEKGLRSFVEVLRGLRDLSWTWTLVGDASLDPEYAAGVFRRLRAAGLTNRVTWPGPVSPDTLRTWYDRADLFVLPSRFETCSLSTREAMARGLPVVGYRVGGLPENFGDAAAGHLVPAGDEPALRAALRSLLVDPMTRAQTAAAARRQSRDFPTWVESADRFREALTTLHARTADNA